MAKILSNIKDAKVSLIGSMPRESYVDMAGSIIRSEMDIDEIEVMPYNGELVKKIVSMNHTAITEFDYFVFLVEGFARVTEIQLVRKRLASYAIKSGRPNKKGKREFTVVMPESLKGFYAPIDIKQGYGQWYLNYEDIVDIIEQYYECGVKEGLPEEDLRYIKPQGTEFKGLIAMNGHALLDWFKIRCCQNAQWEIRSMANKMLSLVKKQSPDLFHNAGASCICLGYCPENEYQNKKCRGLILTHKDVLKMIKKNREEAQERIAKEVFKI